MITFVFAEGDPTRQWLLAKGTGKPLLEKDIVSRRPGYAEYVRRTSGFVPLPPCSRVG
ncbi:hypothetical protein GCM10022267_72540 [Lentzea roselyniae]|uniref:Uncharacterized protein n=1 Tax=Lentzea roselyniae TaxID=531940 RepID=A0ABP7C2I3_9PSEU|nr:hypothetical protein [Lentzea atacamensis]